VRGGSQALLLESRIEQQRNSERTLYFPYYFVRLIVSVDRTTLFHPPFPPHPYVFHILACCRNKT